jgi:phosphorylcholine metabolism protein LicD
MKTKIRIIITGEDNKKSLSVWKCENNSMANYEVLLYTEDFPVYVTNDFILKTVTDIGLEVNSVEYI